MKTLKLSVKNIRLVKNFFKGFDTLTSTKKDQIKKMDDVFAKKERRYTEAAYGSLR